MQPSKSLALRYYISGLLLLVAMLGIDTRAAAPLADAMPQMMADTDVVSDRTPAMGDCMPCAYCYSGPMSTVQGFSGESREQEPSAWTALASAASPLQGFVNAIGRRPSPVPVRIAYCRWSN